MNITELIYQNANLFPNRKAVIAPIAYDMCGRITYAHYTFRQFVSESENLSLHLKKCGIHPGTKVLLFVKPSLEFSLLVFSLFALGAVPVLIDPGVGRKNLLEAIEKVKPEVLIAEPIVHLLRRVYFKYFASVRVFITTQSPSFFTSQLSLQSFIKQKNFEKISLQTLSADSVAAIVYTSGATGIPKGVVYTHGMFAQQVHLLKKIIPLNGEDVDISCFPLFSLFSISLGMSSVIPWLDASKPISVNPEFILRHIRDHGVTLGTGSPAIWERVADYCLQKQETLDSLRGIMMFGAPVSLSLHEKLRDVCPNGNTFTPYGATECLPVSWISGREILKNHARKMKEGTGTCIGSIVEETEVEIIPTFFDAISVVEKLPAYEIGEIIVSGQQVTREYFENPEETKRAKIFDGEKLWHRMGDLGYKDAEGLLWFYGRKSHRVIAGDQPYYPIPCEAIFNQHAKVKRSALISIEEDFPALVIERVDKKVSLSQEERLTFKKELLEMGKKFQHTKKIKNFFLYDDFPVDCRHNIKIDRIFLSQYFIQNKEFRL